MIDLAPEQIPQLLSVPTRVVKGRQYRYPVKLTEIGSEAGSRRFTFREATSKDLEDEELYTDESRWELPPDGACAPNETRVLHEIRNGLISVVEGVKHKIHLPNGTSSHVELSGTHAASVRLSNGEWLKSKDQIYIGNFMELDPHSGPSRELQGQGNTKSGGKPLQCCPFRFLATDVDSYTEQLGDSLPAKLHCDKGLTRFSHVGTTAPPTGRPLTEDSQHGDTELGLPEQDTANGDEHVFTDVQFQDWSAGSQQSAQAGREMPSRFLENLSHLAVPDFIPGLLSTLEVRAERGQLVYLNDKTGESIQVGIQPGAEGDTEVDSKTPISCAYHFIPVEGRRPDRRWLKRPWKEKSKDDVERPNPLPHLGPSEPSEMCRHVDTNGLPPGFQLKLPERRRKRSLSSSEQDESMEPHTTRVCRPSL